MGHSEDQHDHQEMSGVGGRGAEATVSYTRTTITTNHFYHCNAIGLPLGPSGFSENQISNGLQGTRRQ